MQTIFWRSRGKIDWQRKSADGVSPATIQYVCGSLSYSGMLLWNIFENGVVNMEQKSKLAAGLLAIFLGYLGIDQFYLGNTKMGVIRIVVSLVTCGVAGSIWGIVTGIMILTGSINTDAQGNPLKD